MNVKTSTNSVWKRGDNPRGSLHPISAPRRTGPGNSSRRGAMLLEVLISVALMVFGLAVVGLRISTSLESARRTQSWTIGMLLAETKMAELQAGAVEFGDSDDYVSGYFGIRYPGYSWRIQIEPCEIENLFLMSLEIGYNASVVDEQIENPDMEIDFDDPETVIIRTVHRLVPTPADLDLNRDFGIDLEGLQQQSAEGGGPGGGQGDSAQDELWGLINDFLTQHPEILNDSGGIDLDAIKNLPEEDFQMAMEILQQFVGRGSRIGQLEDQLGESLGQGGGQNAPTGGGGRAGDRGGRGDPDAGSNEGTVGAGRDRGRRGAANQDGSDADGDDERAGRRPGQRRAPGNRPGGGGR